MGESTRRSALAERTLAAKPRLVLVAAGAGWGKSHFARELCDAAASPLLVDGGTLGQKPWSWGNNDLVVVDDADRLEENGGAKLLDEVIRTLPAGTTLVLTSQAPLEGLDVSRYFAPHEVLTIRWDALALPNDTVRELIGATFMATPLLERAVEVARGWPIMTFLFARLAGEGHLEEALRDPTSWVMEPFHQYMKTLALVRTPKEVTDVTIAVASLGQAGEDEISAALGYDAHAILADLPRRRYRAFDLVDGRYTLLEMLRGAVLASYPQDVREMRMRAAHWLHDAGRHVRAAGLAADAGDFTFAAACLDAAGRRAAGEIPSLEYETIAKRLPLEHVFSSRHIFLEVFSNRRVRGSPHELYERVKAFCDEMSPDVDPFVRYSARIALTALLRMTFRTHEAVVHARDCVVLAASFPDARDRRALLRAERAVIASVDGLIADAESLWENFDAEEEPGSAWFEHQRAISAFSSGLCRGEATALVPVAERNADYARLWNDSATTFQALQLLFLAYAAAGMRENAQRAMASIDRDATFVTPTSRVLGIVAALGQSDAGLGRRLIAQSLEGFDHFGYPFWQIAARLAAAQFAEFDRATMMRESLEIAERSQAPKMQEHVRALQSDPNAEGIFTPFLRSVATSPLLVRDASFRVRLLDRKVTRNGVDVKVRHREFELLAHLALAGGAASNEMLCEAMWPDSDEQSAIASLRMSVHRLRKQLDDPLAVASVAIGYQLDPRVAVDILEAEEQFVALRRLPALDEEDRTSLHALFQYLSSVNGAVSERESWFEKVARRIEELRHGAGVLLAKEYLGCGEPLKALEASEVLMRFDELDEESVSLSVKALAAANDKTAAMRLWRQYVKRLSNDYGAEPAVSVTDLVGV